MAFAMESGSQAHAGTKLHAISRADELQGRWLEVALWCIYLGFEIDDFVQMCCIIGPSGSESCLRRQQHWGPSSFHLSLTNQTSSHA